MPKTLNALCIQAPYLKKFTYSYRISLSLPYYHILMVFYGLVMADRLRSDQGEEALQARCARLENELVELYRWLVWRILQQ